LHSLASPEIIRFMAREKHAAVSNPFPRLSMAVCCALLFAGVLTPQERKSARPTANSSEPDGATTAQGRRTFASRCAGCHGLDGRGGERAPDIATSAKTRRRSDEELFRIVERGLPGTGMPAFSSLGISGAKSVTRYVRLLQGRTTAAALPGDAEKGHALFYGKARCSECHGIAGQGGFIAGDLTAFGVSRSVEQIREAITTPSGGNRLGGQVTVTTREGQRYSGVVRNEDNFSLQLQTLDGAFHLFLKSDLASFVREPASLMPSDYGSMLSTSELNDLVSFLMSAARTAKDGAGMSKKSEGDEEE
jgi:cytochrome c oxidase cbb3-type subunit III